jgi:lysophospholipase L1-like esterase
MTRMLRTAACLLLLLPAFPLPLPALHHPPRPGRYYLALGDSLGTGVSVFGRPLDPQCHRSDAIGYVCIFYRHLKQINPQVRIVNLSIGGADSCVLVHGYGAGSPCTNPMMAESVPSQLEEAVRFLRAHPHQVSPITLDIGGNDLLALVHAGPPSILDALTRLPGVLHAYQVNLHTALVALRTAAPDAEIIVMTQYNPLDGLHGSALPPGSSLAAAIVFTILNTIVEQEAAANAIVVADVAAAFARSPGGAAALTNLPATWTSGDHRAFNVHPTAAGYRVYANTVISVSGYVRRSPVVIRRDHLHDVGALPCAV